MPLVKRLQSRFELPPGSPTLLDLLTQHHHERARQLAGLADTRAAGAGARSLEVLHERLQQLRVHARAGNQPQLVTSYVGLRELVTCIRRDASWRGGLLVRLLKTPDGRVLAIVLLRSIQRVALDAVPCDYTAAAGPFDVPNLLTVALLSCGIAPLIPIDAAVRFT